MRILVAGGTGAIGRPLVPMLLSEAHEVTLLSRHARHHALAAERGVTAVDVDALDGPSLAEAVTAARPDVVVNLLTAIPHRLNPRRVTEEFRATNRLRTEGTRTLADAAHAVGGCRLISESIAFAYDPSTQLAASEETPLWLNGPPTSKPLVAALSTLEQLTLNHGGIVLRFGHLYGPGTALASDGHMTGEIRKRRMPIVGGGTSVFSFVHVLDAARAVCAAIEHRESGVFNIVDDEPAPVRVWLPALSELVGARPPLRIPELVARLVVGSWGAAFMTKLPGASNRRALEELKWEPTYRSWRDGFRDELS